MTTKIGGILLILWYPFYILLQWCINGIPNEGIESNIPYDISFLWICFSLGLTLYPIKHKILELASISFFGYFAVHLTDLIFDWLSDINIELIKIATELYGFDNVGSFKGIIIIIIGTIICVLYHLLLSVKRECINGQR